MQFRTLGNSNLRISTIGLGCNNFGWQIDEQQTTTVVAAALDAGITLFDTADVYGNKGLSEEFLGKALGARRKDIVLASKFGITMGEGKAAGASRAYIVGAVEASLRRLGTDWIDLYQLHRPDPETPIEETLRALDDLVRAGKIRHIGLSDMPAWEMVEAQWTARSGALAPWISAQFEYSLLARGIETDVLPAMSRHGIGLLPYFPLASGMLTGKYGRSEAPAGRLAREFGNKFLTDENFAVVEALQTFATTRGITLLDVAFGWLLAHNAVGSVIAGATRPDQIFANVASAEWRPDPNEMAEIDRITIRVEN